MAGNQLNNIQILDASSPFLTRSIETTDNLQIGATAEFQNDVVVDGNLTVTGTTTTNSSEQVLISDNHLYLNNGYETASAETGGLVVNYLPTATNDTVNGSFTAGVVATSNPTVVTSGTGTFSAGDLIQIAGANEATNNGLFEVLSHTGTTLTIRGIGLTATVEDFTQNDFETDSTVQGTIRQINVSVMRAGTDGIWETASGSTTPLSFTDLGSGSGNDLQAAYVLGNQITTSGAEGDVIIAGTEQLLITTTGGIDIDTQLDFDGTVFDVQMTGSNGFSIDGTAASNVTVDAGDLSLGTTTSGNVIVIAEDDVTIDGDSVSIDATESSNLTMTANNAGAQTLTIEATNAGAGAGNLDINVDDAATLDAASISLDATLASNFTVTANDAGAQDLVLSATNAGAGAGNLLMSADDEVDLTSGGLMDLNAGANMDIDVTGTFDMLSTGAFSVDGTGASNVSATSGDLTLSTITSGNVVIPSAGNIDMDGADITADATGALSLQGATSSDLTMAANDAGAQTLTIEASNAGAGAGNLDINVDDTLTVDATAFSIDGTGASNVTVDGADLDLQTTTSGSLNLTSAGDSTYTVPNASGTALTITDGAESFLIVDSTAGAEELELPQYTNISGGAGIELTTDDALVQGDVVAIVGTGNVTLADADSGTFRETLAVGISVGTAGAASSAQLFTVHGSLIPVRFTAAPGAGQNGLPVFLSTTAGQATMTAPSGSGTTVFVLGYLQGGDGASTTVDVLFAPQFVSRTP